MGVIFSFVISLLVAALVIWIVSKFNLGLSVSGYGAAIIAALVIAVVGSRHRLAAWPVRHHSWHE